MNKRVKTVRWTAREEDELRRLHGTKTIAEISKEMGRSHGSVRGKCTLLGLDKRVLWTKEEEDSLRNLYDQAGNEGPLYLNEFSKRIGRGSGNVVRKAIQLGLATNRNRKKVLERKERPKSKRTKEELSQLRSNISREWHMNNEHPMKGRRHTADTLKKISASSRASFLFRTDKEQHEITMKALKTRIKNSGSLPFNHPRGSWKAGWREIGGKRNYYRSRWEANYARYLEWLKSGGHILDWQHEPETYWFDEIKRGSKTYLPDFRVWECDGRVELHEVKGWMDQRSRTKLKRMKKYYPHVKIVLIDGAQYRAIRLKVMGLIPEWEDSARDTHA